MTHKLVFAALFCATLFSQENAPRVLNERLTPHWFEGNTKFWYRRELTNGALEFIVIDAERGNRQRVEKPPAETEALVETEPRPSVNGGSETKIVFDNRRGKAVDLFWIDPGGGRRSYGILEANSRREIRTFEGHVWLVAENGGTLAVFEAGDPSASAVIDAVLKPKPERRPGREDDERLSTRDHNLYFDGKQLTTNGTAEWSYRRGSVSPDGKTIAAFRIQRPDRKEVHLLDSSPTEGGRAKLRSRPYVLPGDPFPRYELNILHLESGKTIQPAVDAYEHEFKPPRVRWSKSSQRFAYDQEDRGHQRLRVIEVDARDGAARSLIDERTKTFIWTAHLEAVNFEPVTWLEKTDEFIYGSERSGWRHLYLNGLTNPITSGEWVMRGIERIDEENRQIWFRASGVFAGQDPYLMHFGRVNFDGSGLVWLTRANGNHAIRFSPDRKYLIASHSRVDAPPTHDLRRASDGELVCKLEEAEVTGGARTEVFVAKARDGVTDIWGIICRPENYERGRKYPILEDIYAGPHGSFVPKTYSARPRYEKWNKLGFVVVKIDGMGTANRSKAFHDVCWRNLQAAGFPDRILWMKAAAAKYPELDISRVGVYGTSAGGQNAGAAVLFHSDFYKAAVANCGCHDNRMDKASWNEQWMGFPVGPHYAASSNIENASKLGGALFLIVGELDSNVPPESTLRFADALIKADKKFDMLVVPGENHGTRGPATAYVQRRMEEFFVRELKP